MTVLAEVADALAGSSDEVRGLLKGVLLTREKTRRVDILDKALVKRDQLQKEVYAVRAPGKKSFTVGADGKPVEIPAVYTQEELKKLEEDTKQYTKKLKEATEKLEKFDKLMEEAFTAPTNKVFDKLSGMIGGKSDESASAE